MTAMKRIAMHPSLQNLPFILETPNEDEGYIEEIKTVNNWLRIRAEEAANVQENETA